MGRHPRSCVDELIRTCVANSHNSTWESDSLSDSCFSSVSLSIWIALCSVSAASNLIFSASDFSIIASSLAAIFIVIAAFMCWICNPIHTIIHAHTCRAPRYFDFFLSKKILSINSIFAGPPIFCPFFHQITTNPPNFSFPKFPRLASSDRKCDGVVFLFVLI